MKKTMLCAILIIMCASAIFAQSKNATERNSDVTILAFEYGAGASYSLDDSSIMASQTVSVLIGLNDIFQAGFCLIKGDTPVNSYSMVEINTFPVRNVCVNMLFGGTQETTPQLACGLGLSYAVFTSSGSPVASSMLVNCRYMFTDIEKGNVQLSLMLKMGI